jgi:hypothetical protein
MGFLATWKPWFPGLWADDLGWGGAEVLPRGLRSARVEEEAGRRDGHSRGALRPAW